MLRSAIGALLLLFFHGFLAPEAVWAGCNHHVVSRFDALLNINRLEELVVAGSTPDLAGHPVPFLIGPSAPKRPSPCTSINCSRRIPLPPSTVSPEPRGSDQWGTVIAAVSPDPGYAFYRKIEQSSNDPSGYKPSIFHPPPF
jgi:hypothetical protein